MIEYLLAIIPSVILMLHVYKKDKIEKEPTRLLLLCLGVGALAVFPSGILESIISDILDVIFTEGSILRTVIEYYCVVGFLEEVCKYIGLVVFISKSKEYDCMFDGIVYAIFISLGFATLENLYYVADGGISTAILRMFTSIPGHVAFAVYMGYFFSKYKYNTILNDKKSAKRYKRQALIVPILLHGTYDFLISVGETRATDFVIGLAFLAWMVFVVATYIITYRLIDKAAKDDYYIVSKVFEGGRKYSLEKGGKWMCSCKSVNYGNFCTNCGKKKS